MILRVTTNRSKALRGQLLQPLRQVSSESTTNYVPVHSHLPLSPLMDEAYLAAKKRHLEPKCAADKQQLSEFQKKLRKNPYALALATPVRECNVSRLKLPKYFLQGYKLMKKHKEDEQAWWLPEDLADRTERVMAKREDNESTSAGENIVTNDPPHASPVEDSSIQPSSTTYKSNSKGTSVYTLSSQSFLRDLVKKKSTYTRAFENTQIASHLRNRQLNRATNFRKDAESFNLELMRRRVVEDLCRLIKMKRGYVTHISNEVQKRQLGAILWTGSGPDGKPREFSTMDARSVKVPVYDLRVLLGVEKFEELKKALDNGIFDKQMLGVRHRNMTVELQMRLWKLQGYLADYKEIMRHG